MVLMFTASSRTLAITGQVFTFGTIYLIASKTVVVRESVRPWTLLAFSYRVDELMLTLALLWDTGPAISCWEVPAWAVLAEIPLRHMDLICSTHCFVIKLVESQVHGSFARENLSIW